MSQQYKISIDENKCIVCGLCTQIHPTVFALENNKIKVIANPTEAISDILEMCPSGAISAVSDEELTQ